jgi:hypothetical protein
LIRDAAVAACERISEDPSNAWRITLDSDTQGQAGMCDIPSTILRKIKQCGIFLADLTLGGDTAETSAKVIRNPNLVAANHQ